MLQPIFTFTNCCRSAFPDQPNIRCVLTQEAAGEGMFYVYKHRKGNYISNDLAKSIKNSPVKS